MNEPLNALKAYVDGETNTLDRADAEAVLEDINQLLEIAKGIIEYGESDEDDKEAGMKLVRTYSRAHDLVHRFEEREP